MEGWNLRYKYMYFVVCKKLRLDLCVWMNYDICKLILEINLSFFLVLGLYFLWLVFKFNIFMG